MTTDSHRGADVRPDVTAAVEMLARLIAPAIAAAVVDQLRAGETADMLDQRQSPLGSRRHIRAIRDGAMPGVQIGRRWLARRQDVESYAATLAQRPSRSRSSQLAAELGLRVVGGGR
jgi:hypothetical protein